MKRMPLVALPLALALMAFTGPLPDPVTPANDGKLLCIKPDAARKTCGDMLRFTPAADGRLAVHTIGTFDEKSRVYWEGTAPMEIRDGMVCDRSRAENLANHVFTIRPGGAPAFPASFYKDFMIASVRAMQLHEICMRFVPGADGITLEYVFDGMRSRLPDDRAIWVSPEEGFRVWE